MQLLWRSQPYTPDPESAKDNNWSDYNWLKENQPYKLVMEDIRWNLTGYDICTDYFIRVQDYPYDIPTVPKEQYIICYNSYNNDKYENPPGLSVIIQELQERWYTIFFNTIENQSVPEVRHGHIIKF